MLNISLRTTTKPYNYGVQSPPSAAELTVRCFLKEDTSYVNPTFVLHLNESYYPRTYNYVYVPAWSRYYYIQDVVFRTAVVVELVCATDVLTTFYQQIKESSGFIMYSRNGGDRAFLTDSRYPSVINSDPVVTLGTMNILDETGCFVIGVASEGFGMNQAFVADTDKLQEIASHIYGVEDWYEVSQQNEHYYKHPDEALFYCRWVPFRQSELEGASGTLTLNGVEIGSGYCKANEYGSEDIEIALTMKYKDPETGSCADYRNIEPYCETSIKLPGVGVVQVPMYNIIGPGESEPTIKIKASYSYWTGGITYQIFRTNDLEIPVLVLQADLGVDIPISHYANSTSLMQTLANIGSTITNSTVQIDMSKGLNPTTKGIATASCAGQIAAQCMQLGQSTRTVSGALEGLSYPRDEITKIEVYQVYHPPTQDTNIDTMGYPIFKWDVISNHCKGYIKLGAVHLQANTMSADEQAAAMEFLQGGCYLDDTGYQDPSESN